MSLAPLKTTTALVASLALLLQPTLATTAWAQEIELLCRDDSAPPCPEAEPEAGSTPAERVAFAASEAARIAAEAADTARVLREAATAAVAEALRLTQEAASSEDTEAAATAQAEAQAEADRSTEAADAAEAQATALLADAEAAALAAEEAAAAEVAAQAAAEAAAAEAAAQAAAEAAAAEAAAAEAAAQAAEEAAAAEAAAQAAEEAAAAEAAAQAADEAAAAEAAAQAAEEAAAAEAAAEAAAQAAAQAEEAAAAEAAAQAAEEAVAMALIHPTVADEDAAPVAATPETAAAPTDVMEESLDAESVRTSAEEFETAADGSEPRATQERGLSNLEKALLLGLGAVVVGSVLRNGDRVVANTGDRVVVESEQGLAVYKDDDALLRQPGATIRTETFADGSSRTTLDRVDGSQVVTIRDSRGRVLRRAAVYADGTQYELFDDLQPLPAVDVRQLVATRPVPLSLSVAENDMAALRAALREEMAYDAGRTFSLRQIREIVQVRSLAPAIDLDTVVFESGSAAIPPNQARSLVRLGILIEELLFENPREIFLIEGHTDAVGSESYNLALSDRRAESVALALTEAFHIPPENLIVQGYGESFLKVSTQTAEEGNRRATVRRITPLLREIAAN